MLPAAVALSVVSASGFLVLPVLLGAAAADFALDDAAVGWLGSAAMSGAAVSAAIALWLVRRFDWRRYAACGLLIQLGGLVLALASELFGLLLTGIALASLGGGACYSLAMTVLSDRALPERAFAYSVAAQVGFQVLGFVAGPGIIAAGGFDAVMGTLIALVVLMLACVPALPRRGRVHPVSRLAAILQRPVLVLALFGCLAFFFNVGVVWAYVERMASAAALAPAAVGNALAAGVAAGIAGSLCAGALGERFGARLPLAAASAGTVVAVLMLSDGMSIAVLLGAMLLYNFVWNFSLTYQYAVIARTDDSGRCIAVVPAFHALGASLGPALAAMLVAGHGFTAVRLLAAGAVLLSLALLWPVSARVTPEPAR